MKVLIVGYGNMGHEVEKILTARGHEVAGKIDPNGNGDARELSADLLKGCDGAIEFSLAEGVMVNSELYCKAGVPAVIGTTGWDSEREKVKALVEKTGGTVLWGTNFSIGAHLFFSLIEKAAAMVNDFPEYDLIMNEFHHKKKVDSPSGTGLTAAKRVLAANNKKTTLVTDRLDRRIEDHELHLASHRGGYIPGIHTLFLDSEADTITIEHSVRNRTGLAMGSVQALEWLHGKTGFYSVENFISDVIGGKA